MENKNLALAGFFKATLLLTVLTAVIVFIGYWVGGAPGAVVSLFFSGVINSGLVFFSDKAVLSMHRAMPLTEAAAPEVHAIVKKLSYKAGIPPPRIFFLPSASANLFSVGRDPGRASIAVTHGIVKLLNQEEIEGVLAHEIAHILKRETLLAGIAALLAGGLNTVVDLSRWQMFRDGAGREERDSTHPVALILASIFMPCAALLVRLTISKSREYDADIVGARFCGNPLYLASALRKIESASFHMPLRDALPATAHLFIMNPCSGEGWPALFNRHPKVEDRMARLMAMRPA